MGDMVRVQRRLLLEEIIVSTMNNIEDTRNTHEELEEFIGASVAHFDVGHLDDSLALLNMLASFG